MYASRKKKLDIAFVVVGVGVGTFVVSKLNVF